MTSSHFAVGDRNWPGPSPLTGYYRRIAGARFDAALDLQTMRHFLIELL